ncbi:GntR family transcriptional regulator [Faecalicatena contorta]|uniref:GntR family transcriptional regulator n=1 Tax=Faecalicatena contorta TaxID=39482 RepID=UPI001F45B259|nr:GntR family transcriptional regulator [Faecalicatena contorta]MCF2555082.1 GntR family transcriptional regulator [Faecalicatena contorta]MCF2681175.1 GntR family transcriptional regulator [Faecalicatena contorta]
MPWDLDNNRPIYLQLMERIQQDIITGVYRPGEKLPSVRDLALDAAVNPNTMQKALSELERSGLVYAQRTSGRFITDNADLLRQLKKKMASAYVTDFLEKMTQLGFSTEEIPDLIQSMNKEET